MGSVKTHFQREALSPISIHTDAILVRISWVVRVLQLAEFVERHSKMNRVHKIWPSQLVFPTIKQAQTPYKGQPMSIHQPINLEPWLVRIWGWQCRYCTDLWRVCRPTDDGPLLSVHRCSAEQFCRCSSLEIQWETIRISNPRNIFAADKVKNIIFLRKTWLFVMIIKRIIFSWIITCRCSSSNEIIDIRVAVSEFKLIS